jgi:penicillin-binding protein
MALVSTPSYNSNDFVLGMTNEKWESLNNDENMPLYNRFKQYYCPGSTFKPITAAIALTENVITEDTELNYSGTSWQNDSSWGDYYVTTLTAYNESKNVKNAIIRSDNIFFAQLALKIGENKFSAGLDKLGFGENLDFPISLKSSQYINSGNSFTDVKLASSGYGQGDILVNPIHMASIYSAFVNNGNMVKPYLEYNNEETEILKENVFSEDAVNIVSNAMHQMHK